VTCDGERVTAFVDGELSAEEMAALQRHVETCRTCGEQAAAERDLRQRLAALPAPAPPADLERRVRARLRRRTARVALLTLPLAAVLVLGVWMRGYAPLVAWELARDHRHCFSRRPLPAQVRSPEPQVVEAWFESRGTRMPDLPREAGSAVLVGGRYCPLPSLASAAHVYYVSATGGVSVFVVPHRVRLHERLAQEANGTAVRLILVDGRVLGIVGDDEGDVDAAEHALKPVLAAWLAARP
jgi:anti-sigma factor RsiW